MLPRSNENNVMQEGSKDVPGEHKCCIVGTANAGHTHKHIANHCNLLRSTLSNNISRSILASAATIQNQGRKGILSDPRCKISAEVCT